MPTLLEELVSELNRTIFFKEFSFSKNDFWPTPDQSREFADHVIWLGDSLIIFQVKEREAIPISSIEAERQWFDKKVIAKASKQVRDTLDFLKNYPQIPITNHQNQTRLLKAESVDKNKITKIVLYYPTPNLPDECRRTRHKVSRSAGYNFLHVLPWSDYLGVCRTLITLAELIEYFGFRQRVLEGMKTGHTVPSEPALLGQFLSGNLSSQPLKEYIEYFHRLDINDSNFDMGWLLHKFGDKVEKVLGTEDFYDYYLTLAELAKLNRNELTQVKQRFDLCLQASKEGKYFRPNRFIAPRTGCGFLFVTVGQDMFKIRHDFLQRLLIFSMYERKREKHIGVVFIKDNKDHLINWAFGNYSYQYDPELEEMLKAHNPFLPVREAKLSSYNFH